MSAPKLNVVRSDDRIEIEVPNYPVIPEGIYLAVYVRHDIVRMRQFGGRQKLFVHFRIIDPGAAFEARIYRGYNIAEGRQGFRAPKRGELAKEIARMLPAGFRIHTDRPSIREAFAGRVVRVRVGTVKQDARQGEVPAALQYSVVREILGPDTAHADDGEGKERG